MPPFPQIDIIRATVIVWRVRGKIIRSVLCNIVLHNYARIFSDLSIRLHLPTVSILQTENNLSTNACDDGAETKS